jgi:flagellar basal-body rod protein FlgG
MDRGLYIAASGMLAEQIRQDQIANDLANASTPGYKSDRTTQTNFGALLLTNSVTGETVGSQGTAVEVDKVRTDFTPQPTRDTGDPLDFAIVGEGYFAVQTQAGVRYTRNGQFSTDAQGRLITSSGDLVLGRGNQPVTIAKGGTPDPKQLAVISLANPRKQGANLVTGTPQGNATGVARSGVLEASGADPARAMVDMITSMRTYESGQKVIQTIDETLQKAANSVGTVTGG